MPSDVDSEFVQRVRRAVRDSLGKVAERTVLIETLRLAAATHLHMRLDGKRLSKRDFLSWAADVYDHVAAEHTGAQH